MYLKSIESFDDVELVPYQTLKRAKEHIEKEIFVAEGEKVVNRLLNSNLEIVSFLLSEEWFEKIKHKIEIKCDNKIKVFLGKKELLESIVGFNLHQGIMAVGRIPKPLTIEEILGSDKKNSLIVALDGLTNSDNIGVIVRNCVAFNVDALIVGETSSHPYLRRAIRQSMGAIFELPYVNSISLSEDLKELAENFAFKIIAADANIRDKTIEDLGSYKNICVVFGSEGSGIRKSVLSMCDERVKIPISSKVDSLNVASASAIFLYELNKIRINSI